MGLFKPVTCICTWRLSFSETAMTTIPLWFPFLSGYLPICQFIKQLLTVLASDLMNSLSPRVLNLCLTWKYFYFCAQFHFTSRDPFFLFYSFLILCFSFLEASLRLAETMHKTNRAAVKFRYSTLPQHRILQNRTQKIYIISFYFSLQ